MPKRLVKRTAEAPKPRKEAPEPDTYVCEGATTAVTEKDSAALLGKCAKCTNNANSEVDHLCYDCHMRAQGFEYDEDKNRYVLKTKRRKQ